MHGNASLRAVLPYGEVQEVAHDAIEHRERPDDRAGCLRHERRQDGEGEKRAKDGAGGHGRASASVLSVRPLAVPSSKRPRYWTSTTRKRRPLMRPSRKLTSA